MKSNDGLDDLRDGDDCNDDKVDLLTLTNAVERTDGLDDISDACAEGEDGKEDHLAEVDEVGFAVLREGGLLVGADDETGPGCGEAAVAGGEVIVRVRRRAAICCDTASAPCGESVAVSLAGLDDRRDTGAEAEAAAAVAVCLVAPIHTGSRDGGRCELIA